MKIENKIWEFFIIENNSIFLQYLESNLVSKFGCITALMGDKLSIATQICNKNKVIHWLGNELAIYIVCKYKKLEIYNHAKDISLPPNIFEAFTKCLVLFDTEDEVFEIINKLEFFNGIDIHSFYSFKLKNLKAKWKEYAKVCSNHLLLIESQSFLDLLRYLIDVINPKHNYVDVYYVDGKFIISDENNNILSFNQSISNIEMELINNLITLAPKTINLHCAGVLTNNTFKAIYYIFNKKVNLLV